MWCCAVWADCRSGDSDCEIPELCVWWTTAGWVFLCAQVKSLVDIFLLDVRFNDRWHTFTPTAAKGGQIAPLQVDNV